jgi:hypothetical protein
MPWSSKALPWLIPSIFLTAPQRSRIAIISPWIDNVQLMPYKWEGSTKLTNPCRLSEIMKWLNRESEIKFIFYVKRDQLEPNLDYRLKRVYAETSHFSDFRGISNLHAKMVVTDNVVMETSANLLTYSLYRNVETLQISRNTYGTVDAHLKSFFIQHGVTT